MQNQLKMKHLRILLNPKNVINTQSIATQLISIKHVLQSYKVFTAFFSKLHLKYCYNCYITLFPWKYAWYDVYAHSILCSYNLCS